MATSKRGPHTHRACVTKVTRSIVRSTFGTVSVLRQLEFLLRLQTRLTEMFVTVCNFILPCVLNVFFQFLTDPSEVVPVRTYVYWYHRYRGAKKLVHCQTSQADITVLSAAFTDKTCIICITWLPCAFVPKL